MARISSRVYIDAAATERWLGAGLERKIIGDAVGLFGGAGWDLVARGVEGRVGVTARF